ncbi:MAG: glycosyltransferase family 4 protein [Planctomycetes bacterium]|nr:glycosyltransferase family 4 protein [Planctomycetota bacterium]
MVKKVLRIMDRMNIGGPAIHCTLLTAGLDPEKFETTFVTGRVCNFEGDMSYLLEEYNVQAIYIPTLGKNISLFDDIRAFFEIYKIIRKIRPDIVHTHKAKAGALGRVAAFLLKVPFICHTFHGHVFHGYFSKWKSKIFIYIERFLALLTDKIIVISEQQLHEICKVYKIAPEKKFCVIPLGFDFRHLDHWQQEIGWLKKQCNIPENNITIGIVGRLTSIKNHTFFIQVAQRILEKRKNISFVLIGDGELRATLEQQVQDLHLENNVHFAGWIQESAKIYADLDIVALTSLNEGTPVTLIEALYCQRPVIATNVGGVVNVVQDNVTGFLIPTHAIETFVSKLIQLIDQPELRTQFGQQGHNSVSEKYSWKRLVQDIEKQYS